MAVFMYSENQLESYIMESLKTAYLKAYDDHADALFRYAYFKVHDRETAKDLTQDTFMKTWDYIVSGHEVKNIKAFLYKTMNNLVIDTYRKKKPVSLETAIEDGFTPEAEDPDADRLSDGLRALRLLHELPDSYREAVFLRYVEDLRFSEIAAILGDSANAISVRVHRGIKKIRELFIYGKKN